MARNKLLQAIVVLAGAFCLFRFGIRPPMPNSVLSLYMAITLMALLVYVSSNADSWRAFVTPLWRLLTSPGQRPMRLILGVAIPLLVGYYAYSQASARVEAPLELRAVHPAPPDSISFRGKEINLQHADTPIRKEIKQNPASQAKHLAAGAAIYVRNCMYCHGDLLDGQGHFASGFNPQPADFVGPNTIAQLAEGYVFWRIAKGGPGLPKESTPWNSAMPAWEDRLTEEQVWQVVYYLYETTGHPPRVMGSHASRAPERDQAANLLARSATALRAAAGRRPVRGRRARQGRLREALRGLPRPGGQGRRAGGRAAPAASPRLHRREVQDPHDGRAAGLRPGSAPDGHRRDAGDLHAALAGPAREGADGRRGVRQDPGRVLQGRQGRAGPGAQGGLLLGGVAPAGQEDVRRLRVRQVPRPGRAR